MLNENELKWKIIQQKVFERRIQDAFENFRRNDVEPILIKGWAAGLNYPNNFERVYTDIDLAVAGKDFKRSLRILPENNIYIDLHNELRHLDTLDWKELFENSRLIKLDGYPVRILSTEDHLRVMCVHWLNDGGANKEKLWDIYYAVANRPDDFDWDKCLNVVGAKRRNWVICAIKLAEKYLGLDVGSTPVPGLDYKIPGWVIKTVENEWNSDIKLKPLKFSLKNRKEFYEQLKIRIPPNPIQATIEMDREIDNQSRRLIQLGDIFFRINNRFGRMREMRNRNKD